MSVETWPPEGESSDGDPVVRVTADDGSHIADLYADEVAEIVEWDRQRRSVSDRHKFKLLVEHAETEHDYHEWCDLGALVTGSRRKAELYGDEPYEALLDAIGRSGNGWRSWRLLVCNNPDCKGRARYRSDLVTSEADAWDERRGVKL